MLTGKPPFQSTTADEIYRRAREREYDWPKLNTSENFISEETKDLVAALLQSPEKRPDPDTIVQHPFFTCGWMPESEEITPELRDEAPSPTKFLSVGVRAGRSNLYTRNLKKLCIKCEVGPWSATVKHTSTYREVAAEEKAGLTPAVPLPEDVVYRPFNQWLKEQANQVMERGENMEAASKALNKILEPLPISKTKDHAILSSSRPSTQSFAAQQRARPQASNPSSRSTKARKAILETQPDYRSSQTTAEPSSRPTIAISKRAKGTSQNVESKVVEEVADVEDRLAADLAKNLNKAAAERRADLNMPPVLENPVSLFNPRERLESISGTKPDYILDGLRGLQTELDRALNSRSIAIESYSAPSNPTIVVKWVDYTNKFGLGYILSNGSVGCIFKAAPVDPSDSSKGYVPPACVVVRDAERHLQNRGNEAYADRHQLVPISGPNIEFYENRGEQGISRGKVNPQNYKIAVGKNGEVGKLSRGQDEWDDRKREKIVLWKKFANYMTAYGRDQDYPYDDAVARKPLERASEIVAAGNVVTFYQRFGDVGCWGFCDGHFQASLGFYSRMFYC
jgi:hypothetical protein